MRAAFANAGLEPQTVRGACLGLAGVGREADQQPIVGWAQAHRLGEKIRVTGDAEPIFAAGLKQGAGVVLICGTGSLAWGRDAAGNVARTGGWGYLFGDEGSGYTIALAGLRAAVQSADGRRPPTPLLGQFQKRLQAATPPDLIEMVYHSEMTREKIASLAYVVFEVASQDPIAKKIVDTAAEELATMISVLARRLGFAHQGYPLAMAGSVILNQHALRQQLVERLTGVQLAPSELRDVPEPVAGAVIMARELL